MNISKITAGIILGFYLFTLEAQAQSNVKSPSLQQINEEASSIESLTSLLIQQDKQLLNEQYFNGMDATDHANIKSASKSIIGLLVGIAIEEGHIEGVDQPIRPYFSDYFDENPDSVKERITIKNLLTMRAGLETTSFHNYGRWVTSSNWIHFALDQPMEDEPGGDMVYSTGSSHLLSVIISRASNMDTRTFANKYLFGLMGISVGGWDRDPQGYYMGGNNMALRPADMLKIGQMIINGGVYEEERIIAKDWLQASFQTYTRSNYNPYDYGYMWWNKPVGEYKVFFAWGYGGQYIFMIPELNAVVVMTGELQGASQSRSYKEPVFELLRESILPFLEQRLQG